MKVAFSTEGRDLSALLNSRFGRCSRFLVLDTDAGTFTLLDNAVNRDAAQGAGIQAAQLLLDHGVQVLVTGTCGPKAAALLFKADIAIYNAGEKPLQELATALRQEQLPLQADDSSTPGTR